MATSYFMNSQTGKKRFKGLKSKVTHKSCILISISAGGNIYRSNFPHLNHWAIEGKSMVTAHTGWGLYNNKSLSHGGTTPLSVHPATSIATSGSFSFPPTPPKDGTPDNSSVNNASNTNNTNTSANSEYSSEKTVSKQEEPENGLSSFMSSNTGHTAHPVPTYPSYGDYGGALGFHHPNMFKTSPPLSSRPRQKSRSSAGKDLIISSLQHSLINLPLQVI